MRTTKRLSCLKSQQNPRTINRLNKIKDGNDLVVHFDKRITKYSIPAVDPSRSLRNSQRTISQQRISKILNQCNNLKANQTFAHNTHSTSSTRRYAVFICDPPMKFLESYGSFGDLYADYMGKYDNEEWIYYNTWQNEFPSHSELLLLNGITLTGSAHDAYDNKTKWIINLRKLIYSIVHDSDYKHIKLLGFCFGHQVIAQSLQNGKVAINPLKTNIHDNWEVGITDILLNDNFYKIFPYFKSKYSNVFHNKLRVNMHHRDAVVQLPDDAILMATSKWGKYEMFVVSHNVMAFQGHPELPVDLIKDFVAFNTDKQLLSMDTYNYSMKSLYQPNDHNIWCEILREWFRR